MLKKSLEINKKKIFYSINLLNFCEIFFLIELFFLKNQNMISSKF